MRKLFVELVLLICYPPGVFRWRDDRGSRWVFDRARRAGPGRPEQFRRRRDLPDRYEIWHELVLTRGLLFFAGWIVIVGWPSPVGLLGVLLVLLVPTVRNDHVVADESGVVSYGWFTANRYDWDDIEEFVVADGRVHMVLRSGARIPVDQPGDSLWPGNGWPERQQALRTSRDKLEARRPN